jgi:N,N'-diacetyllegionaminate synthase
MERRPRAPRQVKTIFIAEAGVNHNASLEMALELVDVAAAAGATYVKFQTAVPREVMTETASKAEYQVSADSPAESQLEMAERIHLPLSSFATIKQHCSEVGIGFLTTPFDLQSLATVGSLGMDYLKVPSGEVTNIPFLRSAAATGIPIILSTGLSTVDEVLVAIDTLVGAGAQRDRMTLLHCTTAYPTPMEDANVTAITTLRNTTGLPVGFSDHTTGFTAALLAVALGAPVIEKHFTLDRSFPGPDHQASVEPHELAELIALISGAEQALGSGKKHAAPSEAANRAIVRRSVVARHEIRKGDELTIGNLTTKRPEGGIPASRWDEVVGTTAVRDFAPDEMIEL